MRNKIFRIFCISLIFSSFLLANDKNFPIINLRGYGKVQGTFTKSNNFSLLKIICQSKEKAQIVHSKYLSDLLCLPGVKKIKISNIPVYYIKSSGYICSFRIGKNVFILTGKTQQSIKYQMRKFPINNAVFSSEIKVPMFLNRWDKYGFMFYYYPWQVPQGKTNDTYNFLKEFSWAKKMDNSGFVFWDHPDRVDTAEGLMNLPYWDWAAKEAKGKNLPIEINSTTQNNITWLDNRYPNQVMQGMPGYTGGVYGAGPGSWYFSPSGWLSWASKQAFNNEAVEIQQSIKKFSQWPDIVSWMDPQSEISSHSGWLDYFLEYGPYVNKSFEKYLKLKYKTLKKVSERYTGTSNKINNWSEIKVPQIAYFFGYTKTAINLKHNWKVNFYNTKDNIPLDWYSKNFNDINWPTISLGNDIMMFYPGNKPAIYRTWFTLSSRYIHSYKNIYLYEWDLNNSYMKHVAVYVNGNLAGKSRIHFATAHWGMFNITKLIKPGKNLLAIYVPDGYIGYKVYLSSIKAKQYPEMSKYKDALWTDFSNWRAWIRAQQVKRGIESIREIDPNRQIEIAAPDNIPDKMIKISQEYGCNFHNTGYMSAFWSNYLSLLSAGAGLPNDVEPGGPAGNLIQFKQMLGYWSTEGIQAIDYFIHIGDIMWHPEIRKFFKDNLNQFKLIGKYHTQMPQVTFLFSPENARLLSPLWHDNHNDFLGTGYWTWPISGYLYRDYELAGITENEIENRQADKFKVIIDTNTTIMNEKTINAIKNYIKQGGIFVTYVQTGRYTPTGKPWPISKLTGYKVVGINPYNKDGQVISENLLKVCAGQTIFSPENWDNVQANGLHLKKIFPNCQNLMLWNDGTVAVGMRKIGKGFIIDVGAKFANDKVWWGNPQQTKDFFENILNYFHVKKVPFYITGVKEIPWTGSGIPPSDAHADQITMRHFVSNNGLYDVWTLYNSTNKPVSINLFFRGIQPKTCIEVKTGKQIPIIKQNGIYYLKGLYFKPYQTETFLTLKNIIQSPEIWFVLQRNWWRGTQKANYKFSSFNPEFSYNLSGNWKFKALDNQSSNNINQYITSNYNDSQWKTINLGIWTPEFKNIKEGILRKTFTVPENWKKGKIELWFTSNWFPTFIDAGRIFIDGKMVKDWSSGGIRGDTLENILKPGTTHTIAVEIKGKGVLEGTTGDCWLWYVPNPQEKINLSGNWQASDNALIYNKQIKLPGQWDAFTARRSIYISKQLKDKNIFLHIDTNGPILAGIINGYLVRRYHALKGNSFDLNITPHIKFGKINKIIITSNGKAQCKVSKISLNIYNQKI